MRKQIFAEGISRTEVPCMSVHTALFSSEECCEDERVVVPDQSPFLPAIMHENELELSLVLPYGRWRRCCGIGHASCFTQRLSDGLLHSLYGCCGRYQLSESEAEVLEELFRRCHLEQHIFCTDQLSAANTPFERRFKNAHVPAQQEWHFPPLAPVGPLPVACAAFLGSLTRHQTRDAAVRQTASVLSFHRGQASKKGLT